MNNAFIAQFLNWDNRMPGPRRRKANQLLRKLGLKSQLAPLPYSWGMANVEARMNVFHLVSQTCAYGVPGDVVEVGCNSGESSIVIQKVLAEMDRQGKQFHVYDSFEGLPEIPEEDSADSVYQKGSMSAKLDQFHENFRQAGMQLKPVIHQGWFEQTVPSQLPDRISFAMIDGDLYSSTRHVLPHVYERMLPGAICLFGIYYDAGVFERPDIQGCYASPGVKRATDEFFADKPEKVSVLYANEYSNGYFRKL